MVLDITTHAFYLRVNRSGLKQYYCRDAARSALIAPIVRTGDWKPSQLVGPAYYLSSKFNSTQLPYLVEWCYKFSTPSVYELRTSRLESMHYGSLLPRIKLARLYSPSPVITSKFLSLLHRTRSNVLGPERIKGTACEFWELQVWHHLLYSAAPG